MNPSIEEDPRAIEGRGLPQGRIIDPQTSSRMDAERFQKITRRYISRPDGRPYTPDDVERANLAFAELEAERHVWRFRKPEGAIIETSWQGRGTATTAQAFASIYGLSLIGEIRQDTATQLVRFNEMPLSAPPLVEAPSPPPPPPQKAKVLVRPSLPITTTERGTRDSKPIVPDRIGGRPAPPSPPAHPRPKVVPERAEDESLTDQIKDYMKRYFTHTTMTESMPLISKWFGNIGDVLEKFPLTHSIGKAYKTIAEIADAANLIYELIHEMGQGDAFERGGKELVTRTKPAKLVAEKLIAKKYPKMPEVARKFIAKKLEELFEKYVSDPTIEKSRKSLEEMDKDHELQRPLIEEVKLIQKLIEDSIRFQ